MLGDGYKWLIGEIITTGVILTIANFVWDFFDKRGGDD